jgi:hypothetical protein
MRVCSVSTERARSEHGLNTERIPSEYEDDFKVEFYDEYNDQWVRGTMVVRGEQTEVAHRFKASRRASAVLDAWCYPLLERL